MIGPRLCATRGCPRPAHPDRVICAHCAWLLKRDLAEIPDLDRELDVTRYRLSAVTATYGPTRGGGVKPLPFDPRAAEAALTLHQVLDRWAAHLERADPANRARPLHTAGLARWLLHHHHELAARPDAAQATASIGSAVRDAWRAVDRPADRVYAGACNPPACSEQLYARPGQPFITCHVCGTRHDADMRRTAMQDDLDGRLLTGAEIARLAQYFGHVPDRERTRNLLKVWATRGVITPRGHDKRGDPLYPFGDTLRLLTERACTRTG